ncbi:MAG: hypothetical protein JWP20_431 [Roseomonas sp.]|nr:hypothetical protein [Roseomonas sp.]
MVTGITEQEIDFLARRAGFDLTPELKAEFRGVYASVLAMAERMRTARTHMAEPASIFVPCEELGS